MVLVLKTHFRPAFVTHVNDQVLESLLRLVDIGRTLLEFNLPPWLFTWAQLFFMAYIFLAVVPAAKFLFENNKELTGTRPELFLHLLGKVGLDIALIMGASGAAIAMMGSLVNYQSDEDVYFQATYVVGTLFFGAGVTGISFCITYPEIKEKLAYRLEKRQAGVMIALVTALVVLQMQITGLNFASFWTAGWQLLFQIFALGVWGLLAAASGKPILRCFVEANVATTFVFLTFGIVFWFSEGGDYLSSRTNIFVVARTLFVGSFIHIALYYVALLNNEADTNEYKVKTWHFAEAGFLFCILSLSSGWPNGICKGVKRSGRPASSTKLSNKKLRL